MSNDLYLQYTNMIPVYKERGLYINVVLYNGKILWTTSYSMKNLLHSYLEKSTETGLYIEDYS